MSPASLAQSLPARIRRLSDLAANLWWSWHPEAAELFSTIDAGLWQASVSSGTPNPVTLLHAVAPRRLRDLARDPDFLGRYDAVLRAFDAALSASASPAPEFSQAPVAYFSAEFGLHGSVPIYSGGLGVLAGDHCKEASDLSLPLVGVGLLYSQGYFHQRLSPDGRQEARYTELDRSMAPLVPALTPEGTQRQVRVRIASHDVYLAVWQLRLGRVCLYLLDSDVEDNAAQDRVLSARLYGGDQETRLRQEIVLGIGGVRALRAVGIAPRVWHLNEGHAALVLIERLRELVGEGCSFDEALVRVRASSVFTTHTPVPAGHDAFPFDLVEHCLPAWWEELGVDRERFFDLARYGQQDDERFHMTVLALRLSGRRNAVSHIHATVSRRMWRSVWPHTSPDQVPIDAITNGVHVPTWLAPELGRLFARHLGSDWLASHDDPQLWRRIADIPDEELWAVHLRLKHELIRFLRERARQLWREHDRDAVQVLAAGGLLDPDVLTIGFARRFATYKRASLLLNDLARLHALLGTTQRPVQIIFAGKAHPADEPGQALIQHVYAAARDPKLGGRLAFVEDYDMHVAQFLVRGVDVWLNNPVSPQEACGTSGEKAALNGIPNLSIADGWWSEAHNGKNGWIVRPADAGLADADRDEVEADAFYDLLAEDIVPLFYERDAGGIPRGWLRVMKAALASIPARFSARRMLKEYIERLYVPAARSA